MNNRVTWDSSHRSSHWVKIHLDCYCHYCSPLSCAQWSKEDATFGNLGEWRRSMGNARSTTTNLPPTGKRGLPVTNCRNALCSSILKWAIKSKSHLTARLFKLYPWSHRVDSINTFKSHKSVEPHPQKTWWSFERRNRRVIEHPGSSWSLHLPHQDRNIADVEWRISNWIHHGRIRTVVERLRRASNRPPTETEVTREDVGQSSRDDTHLNIFIEIVNSDRAISSVLLQFNIRMARQDEYQREIIDSTSVEPQSLIVLVEGRGTFHGTVIFRLGTLSSLRFIAGRSLTVQHQSISCMNNTLEFLQLFVEICVHMIEIFQDKTLLFG